MNILEWVVCIMNHVVSEKGLSRLVHIASLPVTDIYSDICYEGSISKCGDNSDWDWSLYQDANQEWVLMETDGPGCIFNFTQHRYPTSEKPEFRFYFDGSETPQFSITPEEFGSKYPFVSPLADIYIGPEDNGRGPIWVVRSFVPMEFKKGCKVTSTIKLEGCDKSLGQGGWGHILYRTYTSDEGLTTFTGTEDVSSLIRTATGEYKNSVRNDTKEIMTGVSLKSGSAIPVFRKNGEGVITSFQLTLKEFSSQMLSSLFVRMTWDREKIPSVFAPIGTFFGNEYGDTPADLRTFLLEMDVNPEGTSYFNNCFPMPFWENATIELFNTSDFDIVAERTEICFKDKNIYDKKNSGYFTSSQYYGKQKNILGKNSIIADVKGTGHMIYGTLSGYEIACGCEGDVRVFLDGNNSPSVESDGSESWASYGWGFVTPPQSNPFSAYHGKYDENDTWSEVRLTVGDSYSFREGLRFELEHGCQNDGGGFHSGQIFCYLNSGHRSSISETDVLVIGEETSRQKHRYFSDGCEVFTKSGYENGIHTDSFDAYGRQGFKMSSFTISIDPRNSGVILRRLSDQQAGRQRAELIVDGVPVTERSWYFPDSNPIYRWLDDFFLIPPQYTQGKASLQITIKPLSNSWNEYRYTVLSIIY